MSPIKIIALCRALLLMMTPACVWAAPLTFGQAVAQVTALEWILVCVLSTFAGVTALLIQVSNAINNAPEGVTAPIKNVKLLAGMQMFGSWSAGLVAFFLAPSVGVTGIGTGAFVFMAALGGSKLLELVYNKVIKSKIDALP